MNLYRSFLLLIFILILALGCDKEETSGYFKDPFEKNIKAIATYHNEVWVGTFIDGVYHLKDDVWTNYRAKDGLICDTIVTLAVSDEGVVWIGTKRGISKFENNTWTKLTTSEGLFSNDVRALFCDDENNLWIGTAHNRLIRYNGSNFKTFHVNPESSGPSEMGHIHAISRGTDGRVWVGSCISGLSVLDGEKFTDNVNGLSVFVQAAECTSNGDTWIGQLSGAYRLVNDQWIEYTEEDGLSDKTILDIATDSEGNIWLATQKGISRFNGTDWQNYGMEEGLLDDYIAAIGCDDEGNVWVGSKNGLVKLSPEI